MNYEQKYLKYKQKYYALKSKLNMENSNDKKNDQFGGAQIKIPSVPPKTYSFLFMPLIFYAVDRESVTLPARFEECFNISLTNINDIYKDPNFIPFKNFDEFFKYLKNILTNHNINNIEDIKKIKGYENYHIPGPKQEEITNYTTDEPISVMISSLALNLIEYAKGQSFIYKNK
jgi:hypothetical protein